MKEITSDWQSSRDTSYPMLSATSVALPFPFTSACLPDLEPVFSIPPCLKKQCIPYAPTRCLDECLSCLLSMILPT